MAALVNLHVDRSVRRLLRDSEAQLASAAQSESGAQRAEELLRDAFNTVRSVLATGGEDIMADTVALTAETAVRLGMLDIAQQCVDRFFVMARGQKNSFYVRCLLVCAYIEHGKCAGLVRDALVAQTRVALKFVDDAVALAAADKRYYFLVYNASLVFWDLARGLMRANVARHLLPHFESVCGALAKVQEPDMQWRLRLAQFWAVALEDAGKADDAMKTLTAALPNATPAQQLELFRLQVFLQRANAANVQKLKTDAQVDRKCSAILESLRLRLVADRAAAQKELLDVFTPLAANTTLDTGLRDRLIAEIAAQAAINDNVELCKSACEKLLRTKDPIARALFEFANAAVQLPQLGDERERYSLRSVNTRIDVLKRVERALSTLVRLGQTQHVELVCAYVWNEARPLLQLNLRGQVRDFLSAAANALSDAQSNMTELRAHLHTELSKIDLDDEFVGKAHEHIRRALAFDYYVSDARQAEFDTPRPLDRQLAPLNKLLNDKFDIYHEPERVEDMAKLFVSQAHDAKEVSMKTNLLEKAINALLPAQQDLEDEYAKVAADITASMQSAGDAAFAARSAAAAAASAPPAKAPAKAAAAAAAPAPAAALSPEHKALLERVKERTQIFCDICREAWKKRLSEIVQKAAPHAFIGTFHPVIDKLLCIAQAESHFMYSETHVLELGDEEIELAEILSEEEFDSETIEWANGCQSRVIDHLIRGLEIGLFTRQDFLVCNAAIYLWNYYQHVWKKRRHQQLLEPLRTIVQGLERLQAPDPPTYARLAHAYAHALEQSYLLDRHSELSKNDDVMQALIKPLNEPLHEFWGTIRKHYGDKLRDAKAEPLEKADAALNTAFTQAKPLYTRDSVELACRIQYLRGANVTPKGPAETQALFQIEALAYVPEAQRSAAVTKLLEYARANIKHDENASPRVLFVEIFARCADAALGLAMFDATRTFSEAALAARPKEERQVTPREWRWHSLAESCLGRMNQRLIVPDRQEPSFQDQLRLRALACFVRSVTFANRAETPRLLLNSAQLFWNAAIPFTESAVGRKLILDSVVSVVDDLATLSEEFADFEFAIKMYELQFDCIAETADWKRGLAAIEAAFLKVPAALHKTLWEYKIVFLNHLGRNINAELVKVKALDALLQAKVLMTAARTSTKPAMTVDCYQRAIAAVEEHPLIRVECMIEYAEWLYSHGFAVQDAEDQLQSAIDVIVDAEEHAVGVADDSASATSRATSRSRISRRSRNSRSRVGAGAGASKSRLTARTRSSRRSARSRGSLLTSEAEHNERFSVRHILAVIRCYAMLSTFHNDHEVKIDDLLLAAHYVLRLWDMSYAAINLDDANAKKVQSPESHKPFALPAAPSAWIEFAHDDNISKMMVESKQAQQTPTPSSIQRPEQAVFVLQLLLDGLREHGFLIEALPVLHMLHYVVLHVLESKDLAQAVRYQLAFVLEQLHAFEAAKKALPDARTLRIPETLRSQQREKVAQMEQMKASLGGKRAADPSVSTKNVLQPLSIRRVWYQQAYWLMKFGEYAVAKELLLEALLHADAFDDVETRANCQHLLARLAAVEADFSAALQLERQCQETPGSCQRWMESVMESAGYLEQLGRPDVAVDLLKNGAGVFDQLSRSNANTAAMTMRYEALLMQELAGLLERLERFDQAYSLLVAAHSRLARIGTPQDVAANAIRFWGFAQRFFDSVDERAQKFMLEKAQEMLIRAQRSLERQMSATSGSGLPSHIVIPTSRTLQQVNVLLSQVLLGTAEHSLAHNDLYEARLDDDDDTAAAVEHPEVVQFLRDLERQEMQQRGILKDYKSRYMGYAERALLYATTARNMCPSLAPLVCQASVQMLRCMVAVARERGLLDTVWPRPAPMPAAATAQADFEAAMRAGDDAPASTPAKLAPAADDGPTVPLLEQAVALSLQCVTMAREHKLVASLRDAGALMAELLGPQNPLELTSAVAMLQSSSVALELRAAFERFAAPSGRPRQALALVDSLRAQHGHVNCVPKVEESLAFLRTYSPAFTAMSEVGDHTELLNALPAPLFVVVLQLAGDRKSMLACTYDAAARKASCFRAPIVEDELIVLCADCHEAGREAQKTVVLQNERREVDADTPYIDSELEKGHIAAVKALNKVLKPLEEQIIKAAVLPATPTPFVLLADSALQLLPLEQWSLMFEPREAPPPPAGDAVLSDEELRKVIEAEAVAALPSYKRRACVQSVSRDLSLQVLARRAARTTPPAEVGAKSAPVAGVPKASVSYVVDPFNEDHIVEARPALAAHFVSTRDAVPFAKDWVGVLGKDRRSALAEWQHLMATKSCFVFEGFGRLLSDIPTDCLCSTALPACHVALILDSTFGELASRRLAKQDARKKPEEIARETWLVLVQLLALQGNCATLLPVRPVDIRTHQALLKAVLDAWSKGSSISDAFAAFQWTEQESRRAQFAYALFGVPSIKLV